MRGGRSLRRRLALGSAALAGLALAGFAAAAWWQVSQARISALDRALCDQTERELSRNWPADHWAPHERTMGRTLGTRSAADALLLVQEGGTLVYRSAHWPAGLDPDTLPWPSPAARPDPSDTAAPPAPRGFPDDPRDDPPGPPADGRDGERAAAGRGPGADQPWRRERPGLPHGTPLRAPLPVCVTRTLRLGAAHWRFGLATTPDTRLVVGVDLAVIDADLTDLRTAFLLALPLAFGLIALGAWFLSGRALAPIRGLITAMAGITAKGLDRRISTADTDRELRELIEVFNGMLERLERGFRQASRFSADAAHELKTPLAVLQVQIEQALVEAEAGSSLQERLTGVLDEVQRLGTIARKLLLLSLADAGRLSLDRTICDLSRALEDLLEDAQMLAPGCGCAVASPPLCGSVPTSPCSSRCCTTSWPMQSSTTGRTDSFASPPIAAPGASPSRSPTPRSIWPLPTARGSSNASTAPTPPASTAPRVPAWGSAWHARSLGHTAGTSCSPTPRRARPGSCCSSRRTTRRNNNSVMHPRARG